MSAAGSPVVRTTRLALSDCPLSKREVEYGLDGIVEPGNFHITCDTNNLDWLTVDRAKSNSPSRPGSCPGEQPVGQRLVHDCYGGRLGSITIIEKSSPDQRYSECLKIGFFQPA